MEGDSSGPETRNSIFLNHFVALMLFLGAAGIGLEMALWQQFAPLIWPPAGIIIVLMLMRGPSLLPVVFIGAGLVRFFEGGGLPDSLLFSVAYSLAGYLAYWVLKKKFFFQNSLERIRDVSLFLFIAVLLLPLLSAFLTTFAICRFTPDFCPGFIQLMSVRWLSDALGVLVIAPFILVWYAHTRINWRNDQAIEVLLWMLISIVLGALVFQNWAPSDTLRYPMELAMFPIMAWAAIRFGQRGVTAGILIISMMAVWELRDVIGPEASKTISQPPGYLWVFVGILSTTSLYLAATWTELRKREDEVRINEERLRAFVHALPDLALVFSEKGICTEIFAPLNSQFRKRMNLFKGKPVESIYPSGLARKFRDTIQDVVRNRNLQIVRYAISIDGEDRSYEGRFAPIEASEEHPASVMVVSYDLTESQQARQNLQKRDLLLKALTEAEGILLKEKIFHRGVRKALDCVGKGLSLDFIQIYQLHMNDDQTEEIQCTHDWFRDSPYLSGSPSIFSNELTKVDYAWKEILEKGKAWHLQYSEGNEKVQTLLNQLGMRSLTLYGITPKGGAWGFIVYGSSLEISSSDTNTMSVFQAITESLRAYMETQVIQDQLEAAREAAVSADHAKSEFLAIMSHEIRTPMNAIIGFSDLLQQTELSEQQSEYVEIITHSGKDLLDLINNILDFSKLESSNIELERTRFNLETTFVEAMEMVLFRAKEKGIDFRYVSNADADQVFWGDPLRLRQILLNLLTNAIKFTNKGSVRLEVETLEKDNDWLTFEMRVIDTGIGIPPENRGDLFKAFRQVDSSTTREYGGSGLGLTIVQRLVDKMGGRVSLESEVGHGSTFSVVLRLEREGQGDPAPRETPRFASEFDKSFAEAYPLKILVVEDDQVNTRLICEILGRLGYEAEAVTDGFKALAVLTEARHNLVLMDMQMGRLDGFETTRKIRMGECGDRVRDISVIALTALALKEEKQRIMESGVDYYLSKPIQVSSLKSIFQEISSNSPSI